MGSRMKTPQIKLNLPKRNNCIYELFIHSPKEKICSRFIEIPEVFKNWILHENTAFQSLPSSQQYIFRSTQLHMGNHVASLLHQDHILRALRGCPKLRLSANLLSHKFCFYDNNNLYYFNLPSAVLETLLKTLHFCCD